MGPSIPLNTQRHAHHPPGVQPNGSGKYVFDRWEQAGEYLVDHRGDGDDAAKPVAKWNVAA